MRILALYQFYLPFPLPRNGDWESATLIDKEADAVIELAPMRRKEALFPRPVDQALKAMVVFAGVPSSGWPTGQRTIADSCIDRVRIEVSFDGSEDDARDPKVKHRIWRLAVERLDRFLRHCRAAARDWNIFGMPRDGAGEIMLLGQFPHTVAWFDAKDGAPLFGGKNSEEMHGHLTFSPARSVAFTVIAQNIASGLEPPLADRLLLDAEEHLNKFRGHEAGILIGTACEVASDRYITIKGADSDPAIQAALVAKKSFAEKRFHMVTMHIANRSLKADDAKAYADVETAYRLRNDLAHEARMTSWPGAYLASARKALEWLESI